MKHIIPVLLSVFCIAPFGFASNATDTVPAGKKGTSVVTGISVGDFTVEHVGDYMVVDMVVNLKKLNVKSNRAVLLTPRLSNGEDSVEMDPIGIYGRRRYFYYLRNEKNMLSGNENEITHRARQKPDSIKYRKTLPYADWMDGATVSLYRKDCGCCKKKLSDEEGILGRHDEQFFPKLIFVTPEAELSKQRSIEGSAYIDFPVNQTDIRSDYRQNATELARIKHTIDTVRNDADIVITSVWFKGYASPEATYAHNTELAKGRTAALKRYMQYLYKFDDGVITTEYEPEDWAGLRLFVENSNIGHRNEILDIIDSDADPDAKEQKIRQTYPQEYSFLLEACYPSLRHTDYRISYTVRTYTDTAEIRRLLYEEPQKLSLNEIYLVAQDYEPGSDEFSEVFEIAVRMFPQDTAANLNAANAAIRRGDYTAAGRYLEKTGKSPEAVYARGVLAVKTEDYIAARKFMSAALEAGLDKAAVVLERLEGKQNSKQQTDGQLSAPEGND